MTIFVFKLYNTFFGFIAFPVGKILLARGTLSMVKSLISKGLTVPHRCGKRYIYFKNYLFICIFLNLYKIDLSFVKSS